MFTKAQQPSLNMEFGWDSFLSDQLDMNWLFPDLSPATEAVKNDPVGQIQTPVPKLSLGNDPATTAESSLDLGDAVNAEEIFPDWLDLKLASHLEDLEGPFAALDDLLRGDVPTGQSLDFFLDPLEGKETTNIFSHEYPLYDIVPDSSAQPSAPVHILSPPATPPSSPEGLVPDLGLDSPCSSFSPISEPSSPVCSLPIASPLARNEVFTFIAPVMQPVPLGEVTATTLSLECPIVSGLGSFTFVIEEQEVEVPQPILEKMKPGRKRKCQDSVNSGPSKSPKKSAGGRAPSTKRERKRMQNKDAATRYRVKKRVQTDSLLDEEEDLRKVNKELKEKKDKIASEISYLKELMREMFKARGLLK